MVFLVLLIPLGVLAFALLMERLEHRLRTESVSEQDVEEFFDHAQRDEVTTFVNEGWTRALSRFRARSRSNRPSRRSRFSRWASSRSGSADADGPQEPTSPGSPRHAAVAAQPQGSVIPRSAPGSGAPGSATPDGGMKQ